MSTPKRPTFKANRADEPTEADARVTAPAADMLAELEKCETLLGELCDGGGLDGHPDYKLWMSVRAVIAKAKGGEL